MDDGAHGDTGRFIKEVEDDLAAQQIYREILHISVTGEKVGKYNRQYCHHQKRIQHRPKKSQHRAPVFGFDIPLDQLVNEGPVFDKTLIKLTAVSFLNHAVDHGNQHKGSQKYHAEAEKLKHST